MRRRSARTSTVSTTSRGPFQDAVGDLLLADRLRRFQSQRGQRQPVAEPLQELHGQGQVHGDPPSDGRSRASFLPALVISSFAIQSPTAMKKYGADRVSCGTAPSTRPARTRSAIRPGPGRSSSSAVDRSARRSSSSGTTPTGARSRRSRAVIIQPISNNAARAPGAAERRGQRRRPRPAARTSRRSRRTTNLKLLEPAGRSTSRT